MSITTTLGDLHVGDVIRHDGEECVISGKTLYIGGPEVGKIVLRYHYGPTFAWALGDIEGRAGEPVELVRRREDER